MDSRAAILFLATAILSMATAGAMKHLYKLDSEIDIPCAVVEEEVIQLSKLKVDMTSVNNATVNAAFQVNREIENMDIGYRHKNHRLFIMSKCLATVKLLDGTTLKLEDLEPAAIFRT
uniref:Uncharacterized protein n=1 Tax=Timema douglasi TaxID=61478 RepID=A0A7R8VX08_TIMDO|nr:unnamed protein product [Timema douglasi]